MPNLRLSIALGLLSLFVSGSVHAEPNLVRPPGTTRYPAMVQRLKSLVQESQGPGPVRMRIEDIGTSVEGRNIWLATLWNGTVDPKSEKRIFFICRQHGHEPASTEGSLAFMTELVESPDGSPLAECLKHAIVYIVPMANPDGAEHFLRHNANDVDLNRDWLKQTQPETRTLVSAIHQIHPDVITDQHELFPDDQRGDFTETAGPGGGASASVVQSCQDLSTVVGLGMACDRIAVSPFLDNDHFAPRLAHRYGSLVADVPTILFETNRLTGTGRTVAMRALAHQRFMENVLLDIGGQREAILDQARAYGMLRSPTPVSSAADQSSTGEGH